VPLYEYRCAKGHNTEVFHPIAETPSIVCEVCGKPTQRVLSPPMIHTQYYFSPQVHGARKPRHRPEPPAAKPARGAAWKTAQDGGPNASS